MDGHTVRTNPFGENRAGDRAYRRAERIASAIHLLTNHIGSDEPVSSAIRSGAVDLLQQMLLLRDEMRAPQSSFLMAAQARIRQLISLVRILTVSGYISMQNATTMVEALDELGNFMSVAQRSMLSESFSVSRDDLLDVRTSAPARAVRIVKDIKDTADAAPLNQSVSDVSESDNSAFRKGQITVRAQSILDILQSGGVMAIKDICSNLPEYSEKMIQRELLGLVEGGKVKKTGLKRWSRYTIVQ
ncbi:hypothetical protein K8R03_00530 [Candidatus Kaiserbacteria bacterium]|nr:hypothetical protein [Candidatus Kaiserbacteria bacterium]